LPGALAVWAFERRAGEWGLRRPDRVLRFAGASAILQALAAPLTFLLWRHYVHAADWIDGGHLPWLLWLALVSYAVIPWWLGSSCARIISPQPRVARTISARKLRLLRRVAQLGHFAQIRRFTRYRIRRRISRWRTRLAESRPPRAWDAFFARRPDGWLRLRLKSGTWIGGAYTGGSYAAGYPHAPQDLYLAAVAEVDPESGQFEFDETGRVLLRESGVLIRWEEIEYLEFVDG
jgi:Family of unknown function (DUF6338)